MKELAVIRQQDVDPTSPMVDHADFKTREAARAVLLDQENGVYLLNVTLHGYHKLPGGGIDPHEEIHEALMRELIEEVGCKAEIIAELGTVEDKPNNVEGLFIQKRDLHFLKAAKALI